MNSRTVIAGAIVFALALVLRVLYLQEHYEVLDLDISRLSQTDNHTFAEWAKDIAAGDILCEDQVHAFHYWTRKVAPEEMWNEWYGSEKTFHQSPLYAYVIAGVYKTVGSDFVRVRYFQALIGALTCLLTFVLVRRTVSFRAGVIAGLLLACYAGYYFYDAFLLRDGFMAFVTVVLALALERAVSRGLTRDWVLAGVALGLFTLAKETGLVLFLLTLVLGIWWQRRKPREAARICTLVAVGWLVAMSPAIGRNLSLGVPPLKLSTRGPEVIVAGNAKGQDGVSWDPPIDVMREILRKTEFSLPMSMVETVATHRADPLGYVDLLWDKTTAFFNGFEPPNNVDFDLHRAHLDTLKWPFIPRLNLLNWELGGFSVKLGNFTLKPLPVSMSFLGPAALLGLLLAYPRRRRLVVPYLLFFALVLSVIALYVIARFRLQVLPILVLFAAVTVDWALTAIGRRRWLRLAVLAVPFLVLSSWCRDEQSFFDDENKNFAIMLKHVKTGNIEKATIFRDAHLQYIDRVDSVEYKRWVAGALGDVEDAFEAFDKASAFPEESADWHLYRGYGLMNLTKISGKHESEEMADLALAEFERALDFNPTIQGAYRGMGQLYENRWDTNEALNCYEKELSLYPDDGPSLRAYGMILFRSDKRLAALKYLERAIRAGDQDPIALVIAARLLVDPDLERSSVSLTGDLQIESYNPDLSEQRARTALEVADGDTRVLKNAAIALYLKGAVHGPITLVDEAIELLERVLELEELGFDEETGAPIRKDPNVPRLLAEYRLFRENHDAPSGSAELSPPRGKTGNEKDGEQQDRQ